MAIPYARMEHIKRSNGKNIVAKSAYNARISLYFEGNCISPSMVFDRSKFESAVSHSIILPDHVDKSFSCPKKLWNLVEISEKRKDSQIGKDVVIALPDDSVISIEERVEMAEEFAKKYFVSKDYGAQVNVHRPKLGKSHSDPDEELEKIERNWHAHILVTERHFSDDGLGFSDKKVNDLSPKVRGNLHATFGGIEWGKIWTQFQNEYFEKKGIDLRVDQTAIVKQIHLGPVRMRTNRAYEILGEYEKRAELGQLLALDPKIVLEKLTENKSVFQSSDFEIFLQKYVADDDRELINEAFWKSPNLIQLFEKETGLVSDKFTSIEVYEEERQMLRLADKIFERQIISNSKKNGQDYKNLNKEQQHAFDKVINGKSLTCIEGLAGTGKSHLLVALKDHYESCGYKVRGFGPDNATVKLLEEKGFKNTRTVHGLLFKNFFSKKNPISIGKEVWIVDESSKLGNGPLLEMLKLAESKNIGVIFCGNSAQLSSVDRGGLFSVFCDRYGYAFLKDVQRQDKPIDREISKNLAYGNVSSAIDMISRNGGFIWNKTKEESLLNLMDKWAEDRLNFPYDSTLIIAHTNQEVRQLNDLAHTIRMARGEVSEKEFECQTSIGKIRVSEGDLIEFRENFKDLNIKNGQRGVLINASEKEFTVQLDGENISFDPQKFSGFQLAYARTYFRSQGDTVHRVYIAYSRLMSQALFYVGRTRHIKEVYCFVSNTDAKCTMDIKRHMANKKEPDNTLKYTTAGELEINKSLQNREKEIQGLCESNLLFSKGKGYGLKTFDLVKSGVSQFIEKINDRIPNAEFYNVSKMNHIGGRVVEVKEEKLSFSSKKKFDDKFENSIISHKQEDISSKKILEERYNSLAISSKQEKVSSEGSIAFQKLSQEDKSVYRNYFDKVGVASSFYTIVQSEVEASSLNKENAPSFSAWQKACVERNHAAFDLLKRKVDQRKILGEKGYEFLRNRGESYEKALQPKDSIQSKLVDNLEGVLYKLFPEGPYRKDSRGFRFGSKGSLSVTCAGEEKGCFYDFEERKGGNLLSLIKKKYGLNHEESLSWAHNFLNVSAGKQAPSHFSTERFAKAREDTWISSLPPSTEKVPPLKVLSKYIDSNYNLVAIHTYNDVDGKIICYNLRLTNKETGKKLFQPISYGKNHPDASPSWRIKGYSDRSELLYNGQLLKEHPGKPVLVVEGEKTADSAYKMLGNDYIVVSWQGGAAAAKEANWKLLNGRDVVIWPDNDIAGFKAASDVGDCLRRVGVSSLKVVSKETLKDFPEKWDLADPLPNGKASKVIDDTILRADNKAIGIDRLSNLASQYNIPLKQVNEVIANIDNRLRFDLEKVNGSKTWETDAAILAEASKYLQERSGSPTSQTGNVVTQDVKTIEKNQSKGFEHD